MNASQQPGSLRLTGPGVKALTPVWRQLDADINECMLVDRYRLRRRLQRLRASAAQNQQRDIDRLRSDIAKSRETLAQRRQRPYTLAFPTALPIVAARDELEAAIAAHQVVIVCGETGSGKSTQLPKLCLHLGRGRAATIAHTQPRRIAARSLANRVAAETGTQLGDVVGYKVRFDERVSPLTQVKVMTDGMLLAELEYDRYLNQYDTIIVDEAHERSLNIDFLLGVLHKLRRKRPDLKIIITSATIDPERFSVHFDNAPIIEVSGRMYPVDVVYRPLNEQTDVRMSDLRDAEFHSALAAVIDEAKAHGPGDILAFFPGEAEIRETARYLGGRYAAEMDVLTLFARLGSREQDKIFKPSSKRRIILSTNIAETSITVPGIRFVIDTGVARISRYSATRKVQRLPVESISQASARQRQGRCGRVAQGICYRLYSEADFESRPAFTDPEIQRASLAAVILKMTALKLGEITSFPFVDKPDTRQINDGYRLLTDLGALNEKRSLTRQGRQLAQLPIDPRLGRMLVASRDAACYQDVLTIAAALAIQDPRVTPADALDKARAAHQLFNDDRSDFISWLNLWREWQALRQHASATARRQWAEKHYLAIGRLFEWSELRRQLAEYLQQLPAEPDGKRKAKRKAPTSGETRPAASTEHAAKAHSAALHKCLLTGLIDHVAMHDEGNHYLATRGRRCTIFPGSVLRGKSPSFIMAAELVETGQTYARTLAPVKPAWIAQVGAHLIKREYAQPFWHQKRGRVSAYERATLYGLTLYAKRLVDYGAVAARPSREIMIMSALVEGQYDIDAPFIKHNRELVRSLRYAEQKMRNRETLIDDQLMYTFYDERIPEAVCTLRSFESWRRQAERDNPRLLYFSADALAPSGALDAVADLAQQLPDAATVGDVEHKFDYRFDPGSDQDGVSVDIDLERLNQIDPEQLAWALPGLRRERLIGVIRAMPKSIRRKLVPAPDHADAVLAQFDFDLPDIHERLAQVLSERSGMDIHGDDLATDKLDLHLRPRFRLCETDSRGRPRLIAEDRDFDVLLREHSERAARVFAGKTDFAIERHGIKRWDMPPLPETVTTFLTGKRIKGYPALVDGGASCSLRVFEESAQARQAMALGVRRLFVLENSDVKRMLSRKLPQFDTICMLFAAIGTRERLHDQLVAAILSRVISDETAAAVRDQNTFREVSERARQSIGQVVADMCALVMDIMEQRLAIVKQIDTLPDYHPLRDDARQCLARLVSTDFVADTPVEWLIHFPRYLRALAYRLEGGGFDASRDAARQAAFNSWWQRYLLLPIADRHADHLQFRWMLEEFCVSLFAQHLGTRMPISEKRLSRAWDAMQHAGQ